jgi:hypothetical protein
MSLPPETPLEIRAVLDRSALRSYTLGHLHIGELLVDIADEGAYLAIPAATLAEASAGLMNDEHADALLRLLVTLPGTTVLDLDGESAFSIAGTVMQTAGDISRAHAVWAANKHNAYYLTTEPKTVTSLVPPDNLFPIPAEDV